MATPIDLNRRFLYRVWAIVVLFAVALALTLWIGYRDTQSRRDDLLQQQIVDVSKSLQRRLDFYREALDKLAREPAALDQLQFGAPASQQAWAESRLNFIPGVLGLALVEPDGTILGNAGALRIGPQCERDLKALGLGSPHWPVHREQPDLAHFDISAPVTGPGGEAAGGVFLSLRFDQLQRIVDDSVFAGHEIELVDANGRPIVRSAGWRPHARYVETDLRDIGWRLRVEAPPAVVSAQTIALTTTAALTLLGVLAIMLEGIARMRRNVNHDLATIRNGLDALATDAPLPVLTPTYVQFLPAMQEIERLAGEIHRQRAEFARLSLTDTLTGMPNRRALEGRFNQMLGLAQRGQAIALVLLDLDHFKSLNDTQGHAAGDRALLALAAAFGAISRDSDYPVRLAGDEFAIVLTGLDASGLSAWFLRLSDRFQAELRAAGIDHSLGISGGQTWFQGNDTLGRVLARADRALYRAKAEGRARLAFHVDEDQ